MTRQILFKIAAMAVSAAAIGASPAYAQSSTGQITVLYDAFGKTSTAGIAGWCSLLSPPQTIFVVMI